MLAQENDGKRRQREEVVGARIGPVGDRSTLEEEEEAG